MSIVFMVNVYVLYSIKLAPLLRHLMFDYMPGQKP